MIKPEDAIKELKENEFLRISGMYCCLPIEIAYKIADLLEHLQSKCDLEVSELLGEDENG